MEITITENYPPVSQNHLTYTIDFLGTPLSPLTTTLTATPKIAREWLRTTLLRHRRQLEMYTIAIGLGVQWPPPSSPGENPPAATLQLCVDGRCLIFQLRHSPAVPNLLRRFLQNPSHTFVGIWNHSDARKLLHSDHELEMGLDPVDLRLHAESRYGGRSLYRESRETIVREYLGVDVGFNQWVGRSDWAEYDLNLDQVVYASLDAYCSSLVGNCLMAANSESFEMELHLRNQHRL